jgi:hypothetical protein
MTMGPGKRIWERFGHNAIWIHDPVHGTDQAYNYGLFDFRQHNFLLRFVQGRMWYWMQGFPVQSYLELYRRTNRTVWLQELAISQSRARELQRFLEWNERPENRFYHYDYYRDNCSTRVRDALDRAFGGQIRRQTETRPTGHTYRFHTSRLTTNDPPIHTALLVALGHPVDRPISAWQEMFLPLAMREHFRTLTVTDERGSPQPLVRSERTLYQSTDPVPPNAPPDWLPAYLVIGLAFGGAIVALALRSGRAAAIGFRVLVLGWVMLSGLGGLVLAGLWGLTDHTAAYYNENLLQLNPLVLPLLWLVPSWFRRSTRKPRAALALGIVVGVVSILGLLLKLFPVFYQVNGSVIALALPVHVGLAAGLALASRR